MKIKHDIIGDIMFYFSFKIFLYLLIILVIYYVFNKKAITVLEIIILLFIFNITLFSLYNNLKLIQTFIFVIITLAIYYLYLFCEEKKINKVNKNVLINRGIINFNALIEEKISYESLLLSLKKQGIKDPSYVDYCLKQNNKILIFPKNSLGNYPITLIVDGKILKDNLFSINKSVEWLNDKIIENNLDLKLVNYAYFKNKEIYFIINNN